MSIIDMLEKRMAKGPLNDSWYQPGGFLYGGVGPETKAGARISELNALQLAVVWCCIKIIAEDTASLPLLLYKRQNGGGRERALDNSLYNLLHDAPNPEMTAMSFRECYMAHLLSWGNAYAEKEYGKGYVGRTQVVGLWPIPPHRVRVKRNEKKQIIYHISMSGTDLPDVTLSKDKVLHTPGLSFDGLIGYSPIAYHREAIGLGKSLEEFGSLYFGQGTHPGIIVSHPGKLTEQGHKNMEASLSQAHSGLGKSHRLMLLEEGMKSEKIGIPNDEAQFLESRGYQNTEIGSRIYRLPPQMYGEFGKASTYASVEQFSLDYVTRTLRPWLVRLEQAFNMLLIPEADRSSYYYEHLVDGLLRGDSKSRAEFYKTLFSLGGITPNKICELENWNPIGPEGDKRFIPLSMVPLDEAAKDSSDKQDQADITPVPDPTSQNRRIYRERLETAYRRLFEDAIGRITRQESQRINWLRKNNGDIDEFYENFPDYIRKQADPVFLSFAEAVTGMESELNGLKYDDFRLEIEQLSQSYAAKFASNYVAESRKMTPGTSNGWPERDASEIVDGQISGLGDAIISFLRTIRGIKQ